MGMEMIQMELYCITLAFIGVLKQKKTDKEKVINCITLAFIGVLKQDEIADYLKN